MWWLMISLGCVRVGWCFAERWIRCNGEALEPNSRDHETTCRRPPNKRTSCTTSEPRRRSPVNCCPVWYQRRPPGTCKENTAVSQLRLLEAPLRLNESRPKSGPDHTILLVVGSTAVKTSGSRIRRCCPEDRCPSCNGCASMQTRPLH